MDKHQLRNMVRRVLRHLEPEVPYSEHAVELIMLTAAQESQCGRFIAQLGSGPARGILQMEPDTEQYLLKWLARKRPGLYAKIKALNCPADGVQDGSVEDLDIYFNNAYAIAMGRANYLRFPGAIPESDFARAAYYKRHWNTPAGAATVAEALDAYAKYALPARAA